jgi:hypothetical protein
MSLNSVNKCKIHKAVKNIQNLAAINFTFFIDIKAFILQNGPLDFFTVGEEGFPSGQRDQTVNLTAMPS